jgi:hypothetical protein
MPLPKPLLRAYASVTLSPEPTGPEAFVLATIEPPGAPELAKAGPKTHQELAHRLDQARLAWTAIKLRSGEWSTEGFLVRDITRARAIRLGYKMRRWAVLRVGNSGLQVLYTGLQHRAR